MFDDRLEIMSPGGMINGSRIQDLDLKRVPSIRRNEIISDIFGRLHFMDRRGSGIGRILNSYNDFYEKPEFFSNEVSFHVVLPNRSVAGRAQMELDFSHENQLSGEVIQLSNEKSQLQNGKVNFDQDWELIYFQDMILEKTGKEFREKTIGHITKLFDKYRYEYSFNRRNIAEFLGITENGASAFIKKCLGKNIIMKEQRDSYRFVNTKEAVLHENRR